MKPIQYQTAVARTMNGTKIKLDQESLQLLNYALGLTGESGEIADMVKKIMFHYHDADLGKLFEELGDLLWYVAAICNLMNVDMGKIMERNIEKLNGRYPEGFSAEDSRNR